MVKYVLAVSMLFLGGCAERVVPTAKAPAVDAGWSPIMHVGDPLPLTNRGGGGAMRITITNGYNGLIKTLDVAGNATTLTLDATTLPGFREGVAAQEFSFNAQVVPGGSSGFQVTVVADKDAQPFPHPFIQLAGPPEFVAAGSEIVVHPPTPGPGAWASADSDSGPETFIQTLVAKWELKDPVITHEAVDRKDVVLPPFLSKAPDTTKFVRYELKSQYPKYFVPKEYSKSGQPDVYSPTSIAILLTQTDPSDLVSLTAR